MANYDGFVESANANYDNDHPNEYRCFHCGEIFILEKARIHFGDSELSDTACQISPQFWKKYRDMEKEILRLRNDIENDISSNSIFNERLSLHLKCYRPFRECHSIRDVFNVFDSMEGRVITAEEQLFRLKATEK